MMNEERMTEAVAVHSMYNAWNKRLSLHAAKCQVRTTYRVFRSMESVKLQDQTHYLNEYYGVQSGVCVMKGWMGPPYYHQDDFFNTDLGPNLGIFVACDYPDAITIDVV